MRRRAWPAGVPRRLLALVVALGALGSLLAAGAGAGPARGAASIVGAAFRRPEPGEAQRPLKKIVFLTNYVFIGRHAPFFVGVAKGFYRDVGFDVAIAPATGSAFVLSAIEGGQADFGIAEAASVVQGVGRGATVQGFGVFMDHSTSGLASLEPYPTPRSLAGRPIAASLTDSARVILPIVSRLQGVDPAGLTWVTADPSVYFSLLLSGRAALVTASSDSDVPALRRVAEPRGRQVHFASFAAWGYDVFGYFLVARADRIASAPDEVRAFAAATVKAVRYSIEHPEEAAQIMTRRNPTLDAATTLAQWRESIRAIETPYVKERGYGTATRDRLQRSIDLVRQGFQLDTALAPDDIFVDGFMPR
jgi:NitT/TauT family transport system substrate-binding protein